MKGKIWFYSLTVVLLSLIFFGCSQKQKSSDFFIIAHRGVVDDALTENSIPALEETIKQGYTHIEIDLQCLKDGTIVCFHDSTLDRVLGVNKVVAEMTLPEIREITSSLNSDPIPTFEEFCAYCEGRINLMPDVKLCRSSQIEQYVADIEEIMTRYGLLVDAFIIGDKEVVERFYGKGKIAWRDPLKIARKMDRSRNNPGQHFFIFNHGEHFNKEEVDGFHEMGLKVIVSINAWHYPNNDPDMQYGKNDIKKMIGLGVDGLQIDSIYGDFVFSLIR